MQELRNKWRVPQDYAETEFDIGELSPPGDPLLALADADQELLRQHLAFYQSLETGTRTPSTEAQKHFVAVCEGRKEARTPHEVAYVKYMRLRPKRPPSALARHRPG